MLSGVSQQRNDKIGFKWLITTIDQALFIPRVFPGQISPSGGRLNKKDGLTRYGDSHVKDKTS